MIGTYYILLLRNKKNFFLSKIIIYFGSILVILSIIYSFSIMGSPKNQRMLRLDERRVNDLQNIQYQIITYWQQKEKLPEKITDISNSLSGYSLPLDPEFEKGKTYKYVVLDDLSFQLCATFYLPMQNSWTGYKNGKIRPMPLDEKETDFVLSYPSAVSFGVNESWDHMEGDNCFTRTIDEDIYPPFSKIEKR
jgi:hypothetical protein